MSHGPAGSAGTHPVLDLRDLEVRVELHGDVRSIGVGHVSLGHRAIHVGLDPEDRPTGDRLESSRLRGCQVAPGLPRPSLVRLTSDEQAGHVLLTVGDNGPGIPQEQQANVFERFIRADGARQT